MDSHHIIFNFSIDTVTASTTCGTVTILLPSQHEGGSFQLAFDGLTKCFDNVGKLFWLCLSDCLAHRGLSMSKRSLLAIALVFRMLWDHPDLTLWCPSTMHALSDSCVTSLPAGGRTPRKCSWVRLSDQQYSISGNGAKALEGSDPWHAVSFHCVVQELSFKLGMCNIVLIIDGYGSLDGDGTILSFDDEYWVHML
jgi:hypothetical protein